MRFRDFMDEYRVRLWITDRDADWCIVCGYQDRQMMDVQKKDETRKTWEDGDGGGESGRGYGSKRHVMASRRVPIAFLWPLTLRVGEPMSPESRKA